jgi:hypothetical protein
MGRTYSAGTFTSEICVVCDTDKGTTATYVETPHPTYVNEVGDAVVQLQMVTLGGPNGLNS